MTRRKILLSPRDPRAARLIIQLARTLRTDDRFQVELAAQGAAVDLMKAADLRPHVIDLPTLDHKGDPGRTKLFEIVGAAGSGGSAGRDHRTLGARSGVDEALVHLCEDRPVFSLQD